ncbi:PorV/PorQ family protein [Myroides sp. BIT-d1]|uniref:PorV/PorQ family protein n=1 Tax=Myroides albus TaxID=2562892 RepID=A0A6I3LM27_9FLAO|nr:PorV/PorQ family protein [Myroides albus]MTG97611.1 PorV/PorQ family protein [Myroides albus]
MFIKILQYISITALFSLSFSGFGQQRGLPVLETPGSAESLAKGLTTMARASQAFIYSNPASIFNTNTKFNTSYSVGLLPTQDKNMSLHSIATAYQRDRSAFFMGARYFSMGSITEQWDSEMNPIDQGKKLDFYSYTLDLGYAYRISNSFTGYTKLGFANQRVISNFKAYYLTLGIFYSGNIHQGIYSLGVEVSNLGFDKYKDKTKSLPSLLKLGGSILLPTFENHQIEIASNYGLYMPVDDYVAKSHFNMGVNYIFLDKYSISTGGHIGENNDYLTTGLGLKYQSFRFNIASKIAMRQDLENIYMLDIGYSL